MIADVTSVLLGSFAECVQANITGGGRHGDGRARRGPASGFAIGLRATVMALKRVFARFFLPYDQEPLMVLWWIGNAILLFVVLPVVIALLNRVLAAVERIRGACDDILAHGVELLGEVDAVPELLADDRRDRAARSPSAPPATRARSHRLLPPKEA